MKLLASLLTIGLMVTPALAATQNFNDVAVVDVACSKTSASDADSHTRACAWSCQKSGFGIVTADKKFLKFDADGNAKMLAELKATDKADHLRVNVSGDVHGDMIRVSSVKLQ
jgi:hypothetical protein